MTWKHANILRMHTCFQDFSEWMDAMACFLSVCQVDIIERQPICLGLHVMSGKIDRSPRHAVNFIISYAGCPAPIWGPVCRSD